MLIPSFVFYVIRFLNKAAFLLFLFVTVYFNQNSIWYFTNKFPLLFVYKDIQKVLRVKTKCMCNV